MGAIMPDSEQILSPVDVEKRWPRFSVKFQKIHRKQGNFAPFFMVGSKLFYRESSFLQWLDEQEQLCSAGGITDA
jgi:hypothetical protein